MSSKPSTPVLQRRYAESEVSRIPISRSPIPFHRTFSMRLRPNCLLNQLNETTLRQHNKNFTHLKSDDKAQQLKLNLRRARRGSLSMDSKSDANTVDTGGGDGAVACDEVDKAVSAKPLMNGDLSRSCHTTKNDRGMVSLFMTTKLIITRFPFGRVPVSRQVLGLKKIEIT
jgi:hypothetical protein